MQQRWVAELVVDGALDTDLARFGRTGEGQSSGTWKPPSLIAAVVAGCSNLDELNLVGGKSRKASIAHMPGVHSHHPTLA